MFTYGTDSRYYQSKAAEGNKAAASRARKATLELEKLGKEFRKQSIAELK